MGGSKRSPKGSPETGFEGLASSLPRMDSARSEAQEGAFTIKGRTIEGPARPTAEGNAAGGGGGGGREVSAVTAVAGSTGGAEPQIAPAVRMLIKDLAGQIEYVGGQPMLPKMPSRQVIGAVVEAIAVMNRDMAPARDRGVVTTARAQAELTRLCVGYLNKADAEQSASLFMAELGGKFPLWAIAQACDQIRDGGSIAVRLEVKPAFLPSVPQMIQLCKSIMSPHDALREAANRVASVKRAVPVVEAPEARERLAKKMEGLAGQLVGDRSAEKAEADQAANERMANVNERIRLSEYAAAGYAPPEVKAGGIPVSLSLLRNLGAITEDQPESNSGRSTGGGNGKSARRR